MNLTVHALEKTKTIAAVITLAVVLLVGWVAFHSGPEISFALLYLIPICYAAWFIGRTAGILTAAISGIIGLACELAWVGHFSSPAIHYWNAATRLGIFLAAAFIVSNLHSVNKRLEESLNQTEERRRELFECNPSPMWVYHVDTLAFLAVNDAAIQHYGFSRQEFLNMTIRDIRPPHEVLRLAQITSQKNPGILLSGIWQQRKKDGKLIFVEIISHGIIFSGQPARLVLALDVTKRKESEQQLQKLNQELALRVTDRTAELQARVAEVEKLNRGMINVLEDLQAARHVAEEFARRTEEANLQLSYANKELEAFSYSVSHDLRAPLRAIGGLADILLEDCASQLSPDCHEHLLRVQASQKRMSSLIDDLMKLSLISQGELRLQGVDLTALARTIGAELRSRNPEHTVNFVVQEGLRVNADPGLFRIVIENLLNNAWKFTSRQLQPRVEVGCTCQAGGRPTYYVRDNGAGFDMDQAPKLFKAFQRLHQNEAFEGTGIGLAIVQRIIQRHDGQIWAASRPDEGATFSFTLP